MKNRVGVIVLVVVALGLLVGLVVSRKQAADQQQQDIARIESLSNRWVTTSAALDAEKQNATLLEKDLTEQRKAFLELTNNYSVVSANLSQTKSTLDQTEASLKATQEEVAKRDTKITELEAQNQALDKQALDLSTAITNLTTQIADTQKRLATSEGDKAFLQKELKRLMAEKAELERQFNDLSVLRAQVSKLKEELSIARRIEWIRQGLFNASEQKGAQKLMQGALGGTQMQPKAAPKPSYDLNVEVRADGSVKVIPPITNAPPANPAPAK